MKKQFISIAAAIAFALSAGALIAGDGPDTGSETLGKINSTDGIILAQSSFDRMARDKRRDRSRRPGSYRAPKRPMRVLSSYLSRTSSVRATRRRDQRVRPGERVYFYYKVGPIRVRKRRAPLRTRLVVRKNGRTIYNGSWRTRDAARAGAYSRGKYLRSYQSSQWSYRVPTYRAKGRYTATVYVKDVNHGQTLSVNYNFTVRRSRSTMRRDRGRYDRGRDKSYGRTRKYRRTPPRRATRYNRSRYGGTRYHKTRYYKR